MSNTTKGVWHRPEAEPGAYANGYDRIWGNGKGEALPPVSDEVRVGQYINWTQDDEQPE